MVELDYIVKVADKFEPDVDADGLHPSNAPYQFEWRYEEGWIDTSRRNKYLASEEVIDTIKAFSLDVDKFWYLCLFIKDLVEGYTVDTTKRILTRREELVRLVEEMDKLDSVIEKTFISTKHSGVLTFKCGKHPITITDGQTLSLIKYAISELLDKCKSHNSYFDSGNLDFKNKTSYHTIHKISLFNKYLGWFMKPLVADKDSMASKDKSLLVSRMVFVLGISDDERYFEEYKDNGDKLNFLQNNIKKYKDFTPSTYNKYYY